MRISPNGHLESSETANRPARSEIGLGRVIGGTYGFVQQDA